MSRILLRVLHPTFQPVTAKKILARNMIGKNIGNFAFSYAAERQLSSPQNQVTAAKVGPLFEDPDMVNKNFDHVVMPLANHFRASNLKALHSQAAAMEKLTIPVTVLGVGGQASLDGEVTREAEEVAKATKRFVRAALERTPSIGVRGEYTKEYLVDLGFEEDRIDVIGCPSLFLRGDDLPLDLPDEIDPDGPLAINLSHYLAPMGPILLENLRRYPQIQYFAQDIQTLRLMMKGIPAPGSTANPDLPLRPDHPAMAPGRSVFPVNVPGWMDALAQKQISFGSRIHGNIVALLAGTPAIVLAHDSRTLELARYHEIPHFPIVDLAPEEATAEALYARADYTGFLEGHRARFEHYRDFLDQHGLPHIFGPDGGGEEFDARIAQLKAEGKLDPPYESTGIVAPPVPAQKSGKKKAAAKVPERSALLTFLVRVKGVLRRIRRRLRAR